MPIDTTFWPGFTPSLSSRVFGFLILSAHLGAAVPSANRAVPPVNVTASSPSFTASFVISRNGMTSRNVPLKRSSFDSSNALPSERWRPQRTSQRASAPMSASHLAGLFHRLISRVVRLRCLGSGARRLHRRRRGLERACERRTQLRRLDLAERDAVGFDERSERTNRLGNAGERPVTIDRAPRSGRRRITRHEPRLEVHALHLEA